MSAPTWRRRSAAASWRWRLPDPEGGWAPVLAAAVEALGDMARPAAARVVSTSGGDEAWQGPPGEALLEFVAGAADLRAVFVQLSLRVLDPDGTERELPRGGRLVLEVPRDRSGGALPGQASLSLWLDVELYDPDAGGGANWATARRNAPRLEGFLQRVQDLGGTCIELEGRGPGELTEGGYFFEDRDDSPSPGGSRSSGLSDRLAETSRE